MSYCKTAMVTLLVIVLNLSHVVYADESEIYFAVTDTSGFKPNVLFILDVSGSMQDTVKGDSTVGGKRLDNLKHALYSILDGEDITKTNTGIITFENRVYQDRAMIDGSTIATSRNINVKGTAGDMVTYVQPVYTRFDNGLDRANSITSAPVSSPSYSTSMLTANGDVYFGFRFSNILLNNYAISGLNDSTTKGIDKVELMLGIRGIGNMYPTPTAKQYKVYIDEADNAPHLDTLPVTKTTMKRQAKSPTSTTCEYDYNKLAVDQWASCDVTELVRDKITSSGWQAGKAMSFYIWQEVDKNPIFFNFYTKPTLNPEYPDIQVPYLKLTVNKKLIAENTKTEVVNIEQQVSELVPLGGTATVPAMLFAAKYISDKTPSGKKGPYHAGTFPSPIERSCQTTHFVIMSDGDANVNDATSAADYMGNTLNCRVLTVDGVVYSTDPSSSSERGFLCGRQLSYWLATTPQTAFNDNYVTTHTVGFGADMSVAGEKFLRDLATVGKGGYYSSQNTTGLTDAFSDIIYKAINAGSPAMSGQVISNSVSQYNQRTEAYYTIFTSTEKDYWSGNLKGFYLVYEYLTLPNGFVSRRPVLKDRNKSSAVLNSDGAFIEGTSSFWSSGDASVQSQGGVVGQLAEPANRNIFTIPNVSSAQIIELKAENSAQFTDAQLGTSGEAERKALLNFARGYEYSTLGDTPVVANKKIADGSRALVGLATYGCGANAGNTTPVLQCSTSDLMQLAFFPSNDGVLRAFDLRSGKNLYEFMPVELLSVINKMHKQKGVGRNIIRTYGLDGTVKIQHDDTNKNDYIDDGEKAYAFVTAGRGGRFFYILDVSSFTNTKPEVVKVINNASAGFSKLGYTWSVPASGKIKVGNDTKNVFIFGGGYDPKQDDTTARASDTMGNALYIINAENGSMIWSSDTAGINMNYSIPASPSVLVDETTGLITDIVVGDMGGQLWRFGVNNGSTGTSLITKAGNNGLVASIASNDVNNSRRFYVTPQLYTMLNPVTGIKSLSVSIGSGYFGHPLNKEITDKLYVFFLPKVAAAGAVIDESLLGKAISSTANTTTTSITANGFYVTLGQDSMGKGEKVITDLKADSKRVVFNTYVPNTDTSALSDSCRPYSGKQRTYVYDLVTGENMLQSEYVETLISGLPSDVALYCSGRACTFITKAGELSSTDILPKDKAGGYPTNFLRCGPGSDHPYCTYGVGWSDLFDPDPK